MKILMVCLGNICRSPMAEGILQYKADRAGLNWKVDSAGTGDWHCGEPPHPLSRKVAGIYGIDISHQRGRQFTKEDMNRFEKIYVMDENNYTGVKNISGTSWNENKVDYFLNELYPGENRNVPDPWYGQEKDYHAVFELLSKAADAMIARYLGRKTEKSTKII